MLPPPPASRQASYAYTLPRNTRNPSFAPSHTRRPSGYESLEDDEGREAHVEDDDGTFEERLAAEEDLEGAGGGERGLEETLEKLGFGESAGSSLGVGLVLTFRRLSLEAVGE